MSKKPRYYDLSSVEITDISSEGKGIAKIEGKVIFVEHGVTGDVVDLHIRKSHKNYDEGKITALLTPSENRQDAYCLHYEKCGGCKTQHINYSSQLIWKEQVVRDALERIGGFQNLSIRPIVGCEDTKYYRNKLDYAVSNKRWLSEEEIHSEESFNRSGIGFHLVGMFDKVLDITRCYHMPEIHNDIRNHIRNAAIEYNIPFYDILKKEGCLRNILMRNNVLGEWMICIQVWDLHENFLPLLKSIKERFPQIISLQYAINKKSNNTIYDLDFQIFHGIDFIYEYLHEKKFRITPKSFFQTNTRQCIRLYDLIGSMAEIQENDIVYDLYCGVGSIGIYLADKAKKIVGIELIEDAVKDARNNALINGMDNCQYYASDIRSLFTSEFISKAGSPDVIITDPPRAGMHPDVVSALCHSGAPKIVYVSCNPQTMAHDLQTLYQNYAIKAIQPVDMFPNTIHIEAICLLERKNDGIIDE